MKALIVYGTRWGSTADVAKKIGEVIIGKGSTVDIVNAKEEIPNVDPYDLIVIGSGINMGKWTKETLDFLKNNATSLRQKKTALFVSCGLVLREGGIEKTKKDYLIKVANEYALHPTGYGAFGGYIDFTGDYGLFSSLFVKSSKNKCKKMGIDVSKPYDFRNWADIINWAKKLAIGDKV
jgi:menaquinone-dependent protoporphyrinogen oxidase